MGWRVVLGTRICIRRFSDSAIVGPGRCRTYAGQLRLGEVSAMGGNGRRHFWERLKGAKCHPKSWRHTSHTHTTITHSTYTGLHTMPTAGAKRADSPTNLCCPCYGGRLLLRAVLIRLSRSSLCSEGREEGRHGWSPLTHLAGGCACPPLLHIALLAAARKQCAKSSCYSPLDDAAPLSPPLCPPSHGTAKQEAATIPHDYPGGVVVTSATTSATRSAPALSSWGWKALAPALLYVPTPPPTPATSPPPLACLNTSV